MQMQPQPQQASPAQATQGALQQAQAQPKPGQVAVQPQQPQEGGDGQDNFDQEILENLQSHLNQLDPKQKTFLASSLQHYANIVIPVLGIVCGQEVFDYFLNIYKQNFAKGADKPIQPVQQQQPNSAPSPQGQPPNSSPAPQQAMPQAQPPQAQATQSQPSL